MAGVVRVVGWWGGEVVSPAPAVAARAGPAIITNLLSHSAGWPWNAFIISPTDLHSCVHTATMELFEAISRSTRPRSATLGSFSFMFQVTTPTWLKNGETVELYDDVFGEK